MGRLLGDAGEERAFLLRFDYSGGLAIDEEEVVAGAGLEGGFADGDSPTRERVELLVVLDDPPGGDKLFVYRLTGALLWVDVGNCPPSDG